MSGSYRFVFARQVPLTDSEMSLHLAMFAVEGLADRVQVRLDAGYQVDAANHVICINGGTRVGRLVARVFAGLLLREFGEDAFQVERVGQGPQLPTSNHPPGRSLHDAVVPRTARPHAQATTALGLRHRRDRQEHLRRRGA